MLLLEAVSVFAGLLLIVPFTFIHPLISLTNKIKKGGRRVIEYHSLRKELNPILVTLKGFSVNFAGGD